MVKFVRRDLVCGTDIRMDSFSNRCLDIVEIICDMIVNSGTGWGYDPRTPFGEHLYVHSKNGSYQFPFTYLINNESGAKLLVTAFIGNSRTSSYAQAPNNLVKINIKNYLYPKDAESHFDSSDYNVGPVGVNMSMIPAGSNSVFPDVIPDTFTDIWIPNDAIPIVTQTPNYSAYLYGGEYPFGCVTTGDILSYGLFIDKEFILVSSSMNNTTTRSQLYPDYAIGKIFGTLVNEEDSGYQSKYGAVQLWRNLSQTYVSTQNVAINLNNGTETTIKGLNMAYLNNTSTSIPAAFMFAANGEPIRCMNFYCTPSWQLLGAQSNNEVTSGVTRWIPIAVANLDNPIRGVVPGDGLKGYLDTELFRVAISTKGNFYDNGKFVAFEQGLLVAWDPDATDTIM